MPADTSFDLGDLELVLACVGPTKLIFLQKCIHNGGAKLGPINFWKKFSRYHIVRVILVILKNLSNLYPSGPRLLLLLLLLLLFVIYKKVLNYIKFHLRAISTFQTLLNYSIETVLNITFIALLLKLGTSFWTVVHSPIAVVGLSQSFSTDSHTLLSIDFKKAFILTFQ